jgi:hypothetical protein
MSKCPRRRLHISDLMLLATVTALALLTVRAYLGRVVAERQDYLEILFAGRNIEIIERWRLEDLPDAVPIFLLFYTLGLLLLRFASPRPSMEELVRRPGGSACIASFLVFIIHSLVFFCSWLAKTVAIRRAFLPRLMDFAPGLGGEIASAIWAVWFVLILGRCARYAWDPIELMQLGLGMAWVGQAFSPAIIAMVAD